MAPDHPPDPRMSPCRCNPLPRRRPAQTLLAALLLALAACTQQAGDTGTSGEKRPQTMSSSPTTGVPGAKISTATLAELFPAGLGAWTLKQLQEPPQHAGAPVPGPAMQASYAQGEQLVQITATAGAPTGAAKGSRDVYREARAQQGDTLVVLTLPNGLALAATSRSADAAALEALLRSIDLDKAEALAP